MKQAAFELESPHIPDGFHSEDWATPASLFREIDAEFHFTLDVCASSHNAKCSDFLTVDEDGLSVSWGRNVCWMNPPYGRGIIDRWMEKAYHESRLGATVVCLVPSSTSTAWWHDFALKGEIRHIRGRVKFGGCGGSPTFSNALVIFRPNVKSA